jgi:GT2 family glycosyltransferase
MDKVATIILNFNGKHFLQRFLPGIIKNNDGHPVYVVDNQSSDSSVELLESNYSGSVKCVLLDKNYGFCGGYNRAVEQIDAEYYVFLNSDIEVTNSWIKPLLSLMEAHKNIAACQPKLLDFNKKDYFEYAGAAGGFIDMLGYPFCRGRIFQSMEKDYGQYNEIASVFWISGACMMIRSKVFRDLGGFDNDFFAHMEEIDLCWRIKRSGLKVYYNPESMVYHVGGGTLNQSNPFKTYLNFRNSLITLIKNEHGKSLFWKVPLRLSLDLIAALKFLFGDSYRDAFAVIRADLHIIKNLPYYLKKRERFSDDDLNLDGIYGRILVFSYYILRRKYFFNLRSIIPNNIVPSS